MNSSSAEDTLSREANVASLKLTYFWQVWREGTESLWVVCSWFSRLFPRNHSLRFLETVTFLKGTHQMQAPQENRLGSVGRPLPFPSWTLLNF